MSGSGAVGQGPNAVVAGEGSIAVDAMYGRNPVSQWKPGENLNSQPPLGWRTHPALL